MQYTVDRADARIWLDENQLGIRHACVITDPPHLDTYSDAEEHLQFTREWYPKALGAKILVHTCGYDQSELLNYRIAAGDWPDWIALWQHAAGYHYIFAYGIRVTEAPVLITEKPWLYGRFMKEGDRIWDPFCGLGDTFLAANRAKAAGWHGCDIDELKVNKLARVAALAE